MIDYDRARRRHPVLKAALTRAKKKGPKAVIETVERAFAEFDEWGAWPDDWHRWNIAKDDAVFELSRRSW